jgi:hypothetical protein
LQETPFYLEYGSGGSTVFAANCVKVPRILSIDSDPTWVTLVKHTCHRNEQMGVQVDWVDIGPTKEWGFPIDTECEETVQRFPTYSQWPWTVLHRDAQDDTDSPSLILIDGRFRVACFLQCLLHARSGTRVLFDDYVNRPDYHVIQEFCTPVAFHGNLAEFVIHRDDVQDKSRLQDVFFGHQHNSF